MKTNEQCLYNGTKNQYSINAPSNQHYDCKYLKEKVLPGLTPINSPDVSPLISLKQIEDPDHVIKMLKLDQESKNNLSMNYFSQLRNGSRVIHKEQHQAEFDTVNNSEVENDQKDQQTGTAYVAIYHQKQIEAKKSEDLASELQGFEQEVYGTSNKSTESKFSVFQKISTTNNNNKIELKDNSLEFYNINEAQKKKVMDLKNTIASKIETKNIHQQIFKKFDNFTFLKFLNARDGSINDSCQMFVDFLQWRIDNQVENINEFQFQEYDQVQNVYPHGFHGFDNEGRPIWIENLGKLKLKELMAVTNEQRLKKYFIQNFEYLVNEVFPTCSKMFQKPVYQYIIILDMKDHNLSLNDLKSFLNMTSNITKNNYPEILYKMYIVNTSSFFSFLWKGVKYILNEKTRLKVEILSNQFLKSVNGKIKIESIPLFLGGTCQHCVQIQKEIDKNKNCLSQKIFCLKQN
ncbi:hypothetical protein ABPG74_016829 [Tetrahymena malaccensis]